MVSLLRSTQSPADSVGQERSHWRHQFSGYIGALASVGALILLRLLVMPLIGVELPLMACLLAVAWTAWNFGRGPALFTLFICLLLGWYIMLPPHLSFLLPSKQDHLRIGFFLATGITMSIMGGRQRQARSQIEADSAEKVALLAEQSRLLAQVEADAERRRTLIREMLYSVTEGRLRLCDQSGDLPSPYTTKEISEEIPLTSATSIRDLRHRLTDACTLAELPRERCLDLETAVGEAAMNAVVHGKGTGCGRIYADTMQGTVQVWICDHGPGISEETIHRAVLERGFSSAGTLGHGYWLILKTCDRAYLLTRTSKETSEDAGTTLVLEQQRTAPTPDWF